MSDNRKFDVIFYCRECRHQMDVNCEVAIRRELPEKALLHSLQMYHPFCCEECGGGDFDILSYLEDEREPLLVRLEQLIAIVRAMPCELGKEQAQGFWEIVKFVEVEREKQKTEDE